MIAPLRESKSAITMQFIQRRKKSRYASYGKQKKKNIKPWNRNQRVLYRVTYMGQIDSFLFYTWPKKPDMVCVRGTLNSSGEEENMLYFFNK